MITSTPSDAIHFAFATRSSAARLSPITLHAEVAAGVDHAANRRLVGAPHHDDEAGAGLRHHLGFEIAAVHRLQVGDDGMVREAFAQRRDRVQPLGQDQRRAGLEPVDAGVDGDLRGVERLRRGW